MKKHSYLTGSFTVETALLFPIILLAILAVIYLTAHVHNRTYLQLAACEQSVSGKEYNFPPLFAASGLSRTSSENENSREISFSAKTKGIWSVFDMSINVNSKYLKCDPVTFIRQVRAIGGS